MLVLRTAQVSVLEKVPYVECVNRLVGNVTALFRDRVQSLGAEATRSLVETLLDLAPTLGFDNQRQVAHLMNLYFILPPGFESLFEYGWVLDILEERRRPADDRIHTIYERISLHATEPA